MLEEKLAQIGFNKSEARIYLELLAIGPQAVSVIAKRLSLNRTSTYSLLRALQKKGLVASYNNSGVKFFVANDPNSLVGYIDRKCRTYDYYRTELLAAIPKFRSLMAQYTFQKPVVSYHEGIEGVKFVLYDTLTAKGDFCAYLCLHKWFKSGMKDFLLEYKDFRIANKKIPLKAIVPDTPEVRAFFDKNYDKDDKLTQVMYMSDPNSHDVFENEMNIYNDKLAIIHLERGEEYGVVIQSKEIVAMQRGIFEMAWKGLQK